MKIFSWNVNGIRAVWKKDFKKWFDQVDADIICLQETKAHPEQLIEEQLHPNKWNSVWSSAEKKGYSGVVTYSKLEPIEVYDKIGVSEIDSEGRFVETVFKDFHLINTYFPNSQREHTRLDYKLAFCSEIQSYLLELVQKGKNVVLCGDYNIAHEERDLANPKTNQNNAGFLIEERDWMSDFLSMGFIDTFREFESDNGHYTWWSYRPGVREKNIGWRIDYFCCNEDFKDRIKTSSIHSNIHGSDHCPVFLNIKN